MKNSSINISLLKELYTSSLRLLSANNVYDMYESISDEALKFTKGKETRIILKSGRSLKTVYASNKRNIKVRKKGFTSKALKKNTVIAIDKKAIKTNHPEYANADISSVFFVPLGFENDVIGVLIIRFHKKVSLTEDESDFLKLFGSMASLALQKMLALHYAKDALRKRDVFIGMAAHELRTPLTSLGIYSDMIYKNLKNDKKTPLEWGKKLRDNVMRITKLVNELLQVKQIQRGRLQYIFEVCQLHEIIQTAIVNFTFTNPNRKIVFENTLKGREDTIQADFDKILQVVTNLLNNAAKFSPSNSPIRITLTKSPESIQFTVSDKGKGITKEDIPHVFTEFYRGENNQAEGMGIGLFVTKKIIQRHKGKITIRSQRNIGTDITITLPGI